ncbi:MarR family winged helix-turn-helix transcriptional regulator [Kitasatospora sp. NPDC058444]|uniref:MarR family winged helix-turn-helix transcriptional regulator n=1 Tax=Kitasatospora sp. NPDC058444 TaxID=3346504 RepID=UPI003663C136
MPGELEDRHETAGWHPPDLPGALPDTLAGFVTYLLRRVHARFSASAAEQDADARDCLVLEALATGHWLSQLELANRLGINRTIMVAVVDALEQHGELARTRNPCDRRSHVLSLTPQGHRTLAVRRRAVAERERRLTAPLQPAEHTRLETLLSRLLPGTEPLLARGPEYLVGQVHHRLSRLGDEKLAGTALRVRHYGPLRGLRELGPCAQQRLAGHLAITRPAASQLVRELVASGSVRQGQDPHDRRRHALELTQPGHEHLALVANAVHALEEEIAALLGSDGAHELRSLLSRLLDPAAPAA